MYCYSVLVILAVIVAITLGVALEYYGDNEIQVPRGAFRTLQKTSMIDFFVKKLILTIFTRIAPS